MYDNINRYSVTPEEKKGQHWDVWGVGAGNRKDDTMQPGENGEPPSIKNATVSGPPEVAQANLEGIPTTTTGAKEGETGAYHDSTYGTMTKGGAEGFEPSLKYDGDKTSIDVYGARAAAGAREKVGVRGNATAEGKYGSAEAKGDAYALAEAGADANFGVGSEGINASANASAKAGVGATGDADAKTKGIEVAGVDKPLDAGIGAHGEVFAGAKAGTGVKAGIGPKYIGAEGKAGAFAGVEAAGDVHGNLGPVAGKIGGSLMAGAGAGIEGGITLENWKLKIGGKAYAALGYGASASGEITIDLKQAAQLGMAGAKELYEVADADKDGRLTLNDPATRTALAMRGGANLVDKAATGLMDILDVKKDGKFTKEDVTAGVEQVGEALGDAKDKVVNTVGSMLDKGGNFLDRDKDGKIEVSDITGRLGDAGSTIAKGAKELGSDVVEIAGNAKDFAVDKGKAAGKAIHGALDLDNDGELGLGDVKEAGSAALGGLKSAGSAALGGLKSAGTALKDTALSAVNGVHGLLDLNGDDKLDMGDVDAAKGKLSAAARAAKQAALNTFDGTVAAGQRAYAAAQKGVFNLLNRDNDDNLDWNDVKAGAGQLASGAVKAKDAVVGGAKSAYGATVSGAKAAGKAVHGFLDMDDDNELTMKDVGAGASKAAGAVAGAGKAVYEEAKEQLSKAADTLGSGYKAAAETLTGTWGKVTSFFGW